MEKGAIIATLDDTDIRNRYQLNKTRQDQITSFITDIKKLATATSNSTFSPVDVRTVRYKSEALEFKQQLVNQQHIINQHKRTLERERILFNREVNSLSKLEELQYSLQFEENKYKLLFEQRLNSWNQEKDTFKRELEEIQSEYSQLPNELKRYLIRSPVSGTLQNTNGILENSNVFANQTIGEISPDTNLVAEVYVLPNEIGLLTAQRITGAEIMS